MGIVFGSSKRFAVEERINLLTLFLIITASKLRAFITLFPKYKNGSCIDSPTKERAAKCSTPSNLCSLKTCSMAFLFAKSPLINTASLGTASMCPKLKLSKTTTSKPFLTSSSTQWLPTYPAPPVTNTFISNLILSPAFLFVRPFWVILTTKYIPQ